MHIEIASVYTSALKLSAPLTETLTYATILKEAQKLTKAKFGSIFFYQRRSFHRVFTTVPPRYQIEPRKNGFTTKAFKAMKPMVIPAKDIVRASGLNIPSKAKMIVIIPLVYETHKLGVISLEVYKDVNVTKNDLQILQLFGSLASLKIRNNALYYDLKKALKTRDLFISMAAHELKTPLTSISAYSQLIDKNLKTNKPIKEEWAKTLRSAIGRIIRMTNELFDINQIRTGSMSFSFIPIDPLKIVKRSIIDFKTSFKEHVVEFEDQRKYTDQKILGDSDKLIQVLINFLNNAGKFSPTEKPITFILKDSKTKLALSIQDHGPGIDTQEIKKLFSEFYKGKNNTHEGLGLGLFISKKIIEAHRGTIDAYSAINRGTTFIITLPYFKM